MTRRLSGALVRLAPAQFVYADHLTTSARRLLRRAAAGVIGLLLAAAAVWLLQGSGWTRGLAGVLFGWATSVLVWAIGSYRRTRRDTSAELRRTAETDLLHHRLNQAAPRLGIPVLDLDAELEWVLEARVERLAHYSGLDEFRGQPQANGYDFWER